MTDCQKLLQIVEEMVSARGEELGKIERGDEVLLFDSRATLHIEIRDSHSAHEGDVHAHFLVSLREYEEDVLDACVCGMADTRREALKQAASIWTTAVAAPIKAFLDGQAIFTTREVRSENGDSWQDRIEGDFGLSGVRGYVGPAIARNLNDALIEANATPEKPWFRFAAEAASPRIIHLAKATVVYDPARGWLRDLEIDGHDVSCGEDVWPSDVKASGIGCLIRYAVFGFPIQQDRRSDRERLVSFDLFERRCESIQRDRRLELDNAIQHFATRYGSYHNRANSPSDGFGKALASLEHLTLNDANDPLDGIKLELEASGYREDIIEDVATFLPIAFGRVYFGPYGVRFPPTFIFVQGDGRIDANIPLMSVPAYSRSRVAAIELRNTLSGDDFLAICLLGDETRLIAKALNAPGKTPAPGEMSFQPCVIFERGVSQKTIDVALAEVARLVKCGQSSGTESRSLPAKQPWWRFW
jgi:hypothetical protein